jgi:hypothetical protein
VGAGRKGCPQEFLQQPVSDPSPKQALSRVRRSLRQFGMLPFTDPSLASVVSLVVGAPVRGSWWGHPAGGLIYAVGEALESDRDILFAKLWRGKRTLVHRRLWPEVVRVGESRELWQLHGLPSAAVELLETIEENGTVRAASGSRWAPQEYAAFSQAARKLEERLLALSHSVHTPTGSHALELESWGSWKKGRGIVRFRNSPEEAQRRLEQAAARIAPGMDPRRQMPWGRQTAMNGG